MALQVKGLEEALIRWLATKGIAATEITGIDDMAYNQQGCPTCYGGLDYEVDIWYIPAGEWDGTRFRAKLYTYHGKFSDLLYYLTDEDPQTNKNED